MSAGRQLCLSSLNGRTDSNEKTILASKLVSAPGL